MTTMSNISDLSFIPPIEDGWETFSQNNLTLIAHLFSSMVCADNKIKVVENEIVETFLDSYKSNDIQCVKQVYESSFKKYDDEERAHLIKSLAVEFTEKQKIELLYSLYAIAVSDGELHPEEEHIIYLFLEHMEID